MKTNLTCPVCDRPNIAGDICPNCETNLSLMQMLVALPPEKKQFQFSNLWIPVTLALIIFITGIGLGAFSNYLITNSQNSSIKTAVSSSSKIVAINKNKPSSALISKELAKPKSQNTCGFRYTVRRGDYLRRLAWNFYGDGNMSSLIIKANPTLKGRENSLEVGNTILIPNLQGDSCGNL